jgi:hypothetical protein
MFCNKCGNRLPDDSKFCNKCGANLEFNKVNSTATINTKDVVPQKTIERKPVEYRPSPFQSEDIYETQGGSKVLKLVIVAVICAAIFGLYQGFKPADFSSQQSVPKKTDQEIQQEQEQKKKELEERRMREETEKKAAQERALQNALDFMTEKRDYSEKSLDELDLIRKLFRTHKTTIQYDYSLDAKQKEKLLKKLTMLRKREMPQMRKRMAKILSQAIWRENGSASVSGTNNTTINIIHPGFVLNANVEDFNNQYQPMFNLYGFKRATFWMYRGAPSYASVNYEVDDDGTF